METDRDPRRRDDGVRIATGGKPRQGDVKFSKNIMIGSRLNQNSMFDIIVIGGGPGGSASAALLAQKGYSVLLLERERFPRFQIGESLLPYNNELFKRLGVWDQLKGGSYIPKFGATFVTGDGDVGYSFSFKRNLPEKLAQSFQVKRSEFDHLLLKNAARNGVEVREEVRVVDVDLSQPTVRVKAVEGGETKEFEARFVVDASGYGSVIGSRYGQKADEKSLEKVAFFAHFTGVKPLGEGDESGNTVIVILKNAWFWLIPVSDEITSVGLVVDREHFKTCGLQPEHLLQQTVASAPYVASLMEQARQTTPVFARKDFSYRMKNIVGENYALVGDAAGFIDPIFSTGVFIAMKSAEIAADAVEARLRTGTMRALRAYERRLQSAMSKYFGFISHFYRREFLEVFLQPQKRFGLIKVVVGVLAGNVFERTRDRWKLGLFFLLVQIQKHRGLIAPRISWDTLPAAATAMISEETFV